MLHRALQEHALVEVMPPRTRGYLIVAKVPSFCKNVVEKATNGRCFEMYCDAHRCSALLGIRDVCFFFSLSSLRDSVMSLRSNFKIKSPIFLVTFAQVLRPMHLLDVGRWRMHTKIQQGSWTSSWVSPADFSVLLHAREHNFLALMQN